MSAGLVLFPSVLMILNLPTHLATFDKGMPNKRRKKSLAGKGKKRELRSRATRFAASSARSFPALPK